MNCTGVLDAAGVPIEAPGTLTVTLEDQVGGGHTCAYFNAQGVLGTPGVNDCHRTYLDAAPMVLVGVLDPDEPIEMVIQSGPAASPNSNYGTGGNIHQLYVR